MILKLEEICIKIIVNIIENDKNIFDLTKYLNMEIFSDKLFQHFYKYRHDYNWLKYFCNDNFTLLYNFAIKIQEYFILSNYNNSEIDLKETLDKLSFKIIYNTYFNFCSMTYSLEYYSKTSTYIAKFINDNKNLKYLTFESHYINNTYFIDQILLKMSNYNFQEFSYYNHFIPIIYETFSVNNVN